MTTYDHTPPMPDGEAFTEQIIPHSRETEEALLGSVLINPAWVKLLDLSKRDFYIHRHGWIWEALRELDYEEKEIDFITVCERLDTKKQLAELGGPAYLTALINCVPTSMNAETYARILKDRTARRELLELANEVAKQAYQLETPVTLIQGRLIDKATNARQTVQGSVSVETWMSKAYDAIMDAERNGVPAGIPTGFVDFDKITGGIKPGRFEILSGVPGMGKSIFYQNVSVNLSKAGSPGNLYSAEMPAHDMSLRLISAEAGIEVARLENGELREGEHTKLAHAIGVISELPLFVSDANGWTIPSLRADLTRAQAERGIQWFVFDYMDLLRDEYGDNETERTKYLSRQLRAICRDLGLHGMAIQSMVKSGFGNPGMEHLAGSAGLAYDADLIMFILDHIPDAGGNPDPNVRTMVIKKGRHLQNPQRYFYLYKHGNIPKFENAIKNRVDLSQATTTVTHPSAKANDKNGYHKKEQVKL